jgi:hypothetical protein
MKLKSGLLPVPIWLRISGKGPTVGIKNFPSFVVEGNAGETHITRIWPKAGVRKRQGVDLDNPKTWKVKATPSLHKNSSD